MATHLPPILVLTLRPSPDRRRRRCCCKAGPPVLPRRGRSGARQRLLGEPTEVIHGVVEVGEEKNPLSRLLDLVLDPGEVFCAVGDGENRDPELAEQSL